MVKKWKNIFLVFLFIGNLLFLTSCSKTYSKTYSVAFMVDDNVYINETVEENKFVKKPQNPEKEGHTFIEWVDDNGNKWAFDEYQIQKDIVLKARFERNSYTVVINDKEKKTKEALYGDQVDLPTLSNTSKTVFSGWIDFDNNIYNNTLIVKNNIELFPYYTQKIITLDVGNDLYDIDKTIPVENGKCVNLPNLSKEDYVFRGWKADDGNIYKDSFVYNYDGNLKLKAAFDYVFKYDVVEGHVEINEYIGEKQDIIIPENINGYPVQKVDASLLKNNEVKVKKLSLPPSVKEIGNGLLEGQNEFEKLICSTNVNDYLLIKRLFNTKSGSVPESFNTIEFTDYNESPENIFTGLTDRKFDIVLPDNLTIIHLESNSIRSVKMPKTITRLEMYADIENIFYDGSIADWCGISLAISPSYIFKNIFLLDSSGETGFDGEKYKLVDGKLVIPGSAKEVGAALFYGYDKITSVSCEDGIEKIGSHCFYKCPNLKYVKLSNSIYEIGYQCFSECYELEKIDLSNKLKYIPRSAFSSCIKLKSIELPNTITEIEESAFYRCYSLSCINLPENLIKIGNFAFESCYKLIEIYNYSVFDIYGNDYTGDELSAGEGTSYGCLGKYAKAIHTSLDEKSSIVKDDNGFVFCYTGDKGYLIDYEGNNENIVLPDYFYYGELKINSYEIYNMAFANKQFLRTVELSHSVKAIGCAAFYNCTSLYKVIIYDSVKKTYDTFEDTTDPNSDFIFLGCINLMEVYVPENFEYSDFQITDGINDWGVSSKGVVYKSYESNIDSVVTDDGFYFKKDNNTWYLCAYIGNDECISLPNGFVYKNDYIVHYNIKRFCFFYSKVKKISIPANVDNIDCEAIYTNSMLEQVEIDGVEHKISKNFVAYTDGRSEIIVIFNGSMNEWSSMIIDDWVVNCYTINVICADGIIAY